MIINSLIVVGIFFSLSYFVAIWYQHSKSRRVIKAIPILSWSLAIAMTLPQPELFPYLLLIGLLFSALGDVFLLNHDKHFLKGLSSFFIAHIVYVIGFFTLTNQKNLHTQSSSLITILGLTIVALLYIGFLRPRIMKQHQSITFLLAVCAYIIMISSMVYTASLTFEPWYIIGALLFYVSDFTLSWDKFVKEFRGADFLIMITYYGAQVSFVVGYVLSK